MIASTIIAPDLQVLPESGWQSRRTAHEQRVQVWLEPHQARAARGEKHPVYDFLFSYYAFRPAWLRRWQPGPDIALAGEAAREFLRRPEYRETADGVILDPTALRPSRREFVLWLR